jgi:hypothetical protein
MLQPRPKRKVNYGNKRLGLNNKIIEKGQQQTHIQWRWWLSIITLWNIELWITLCWLVRPWGAKSLVKTLS